MTKQKQIRNSTVSKIQNAVRGNNILGIILGIQTFWSVNNAWVTVSDLEALFDQHGLDKDDWFPPPIQEEPAARKAVATVNPGGDYQVEQIVDNASELIWGVARLDKDVVNIDLSLNVEARIKFDKMSKTVHVSGAHGSKARQIADAIADRYKSLVNTYITIDIQRMLKRNIADRMGSAVLRQCGGVYFTPPQHYDTLLKMQAVAEAIGDTEVTLIEIGDTSTNKSNAGRQVRRGLQEELADLKEEIAKFQQKTPREDTLQRRIETYKELKGKCDLYASMLSITVDDLHQGLDDCTHIIKGMLGVVQEEKEGKQEAKEAKVAAKRESEHDKLFRRLKRLKRVA